jgi:hypothetical protein
MGQPLPHVLGTIGIMGAHHAPLEVRSLFIKMSIWPFRRCQSVRLSNTCPRGQPHSGPECQFHFEDSSLSAGARGDGVCNMMCGDARGQNLIFSATAKPHVTSHCSGHRKPCVTPCPFCKSRILDGASHPRTFSSTAATLHEAIVPGHTNQHGYSSLKEDKQ